MNAAMQILIEAADAARTVDGKPYFMSSAINALAIGEVMCRRDYMTAGNNVKKRHVRTTWELNGKRISAANLASMLAA